MSLIKELLVPTFENKISSEIENVVKKSEFKRNASFETYAKAETILLKEIGLVNFELSKEPVNIKNFKESFGLTKRLDAEYYQIKYEQVIEKIGSLGFLFLIGLMFFVIFNDIIGLITKKF